MNSQIKTLLTSQPTDDKISVFGWVKSKRISKNFAFLVINDGSCQKDLQIVVDTASPAFSKLEALQTGASVKVDGILKESQGKGQSIEMQGEGLEILGNTDQSYPLQKKGHTLEFLREIAHLRSRSNTFGAVFRLRHQMSQAVHRFFSDRGFYWAHTPILTASDCEGAGEMFRVTTLPLGEKDVKKDFFAQDAHLCVSGQLEGEALAMGLGRIYTFGPTFRAENSNTTRHLSEFWMVEPEVAFIDLKGIAQLAEDFLKSVIKDSLSYCGEEISFFEKHYKNTQIENLENICSSSFKNITYSEAIDILAKSGNKFEFNPTWGEALQTEHERFLTDVEFKGPVIVTDYPQTCKAFYMRLNDDQKTVAALDVLLPKIGEVIGGSQREERADILDKQMELFDIPKENLWWYRELRKYGTTPHGGFGAGFERLIQYISGMSNIRDVIAFPRYPGHIEF